MKRFVSLSLALLLVCAGFCVPCCASQTVDAHVGDVVDIWVSIYNGGTVILTPRDGSPSPVQNRIALLSGQSEAFRVEITDVGVFRYVLSMEPDGRSLIFDDTIYDVEVHALYEEDEIKTAVVIYNRKTGEKYTPVEQYDPVTGQYTHTLSVSFFNYSSGSTGGRPHRPSSTTPTPDGSGVPTDNPNTPSSGTDIPTDNPNTPSGGTGIPTDNPTIPSGGTDIPTDNPNTPSGGTGIPTDNPNTPSGGTGIPTDNPTIPSGGSPPHADGSPTGSSGSPYDGSASSPQSSDHPARTRTSDSARQPKTGDDTRLTYYLLLAILASGGLFIVSLAYYVSVVLETRTDCRTSK